MRRFVAFLLLPWLAVAQDDDQAHIQVYDKTVNSVVAVRALAVLGERSGTGVILDDAGYILTSYSIVPEDAEDIRVWLKGPRLVKAKVVKASKKDEVTILKIETKHTLKPIQFHPDSSKVKIGEVSYTLGNAYNSTINDDQPSFNVGIVSGFYNLKEAKADAHYTGYVFETTAAVNWGLEGGPLLDAQGRMVGMITLNYSPSRWLGNAIPINVIRPRIEQLLKEAKDEVKIAVEPEGEGYLGIKVKQEGEKVVVEHVDQDGPAAQMGIQKGDIIKAVGGEPLASVEQWVALTKGLKVGALIEVTIVTSGLEDTIKLEVGRRPK